MSYTKIGGIALKIGIKGQGEAIKKGLPRCGTSERFAEEGASAFELTQEGLVEFSELQIEGHRGLDLADRLAISTLFSIGATPLVVPVVEGAFLIFGLSTGGVGFAAGQ